MALAKVGTFSGTIGAWQRLLASSGTLQDLFGVATAAAAIDKIYWLQSIDEPDEETADASPDQQPMINPRPRAVIDHADDIRNNIGVAEWSGSGRVIAAIEADVPAGYVVDRSTDSVATIRSKYVDQHTWAMNKAGKIRDEVMANSGGDDGSDPYLNVIRLEISDGPGHAEDDIAGDYFGWIMTGEWF